VTGTAQPELVDALLSVSRTMVALAAKSLARVDTDVTLPQYRALVVLATHGPQRGVDLARALGVAPSTWTRLGDRLVKKDLVRRYHRSDDRRSIWFVLTDTGQTLVGDVMRARRTDIEQLVCDAGLVASKRTLALLRTFVETSGEIPDPQWWQHWQRSVKPGPDAWPAEPMR
jgi:DNA-binding MarR family transcriptional regulator